MDDLSPDDLAARATIRAMRVRLILENGGFPITKLVDLHEAPAVGAVIQADRARRVADVELDAERGVTDVYLREDADDLAGQLSPAAHLAKLDAMRAAGWAIEGEEELRAWLAERAGRRGGAGPCTGSAVRAGHHRAM